MKTIQEWLDDLNIPIDGLVSEASATNRSYYEAQELSLKWYHPTRRENDTRRINRKIKRAKD